MINKTINLAYVDMLGQSFGLNHLRAVPNDFFTRISCPFQSTDQISSSTKCVTKPNTTAQDLNSRTLNSGDKQTMKVVKPAIMAAGILCHMPRCLVYLLNKRPKPNRNTT